MRVKIEPQLYASGFGSAVGAAARLCTHQKRAVSSH